MVDVNCVKVASSTKSIIVTITSGILLVVPLTVVSASVIIMTVVVCALVMTVVVVIVVGTGIGWSLNTTSPMCTHCITAPEGLWNSRK